MYKIIIGIDPGVHGAIAVIDSDKTYDVHDVPTLQVKNGKKNKTMVDLIELEILIGRIISKRQLRHHGCNGAGKACCEYEAWVENVHSMPQQGVASMFSMGRTLGNLEMVLVCNHIPINWVSPQKWKKEVIFGAGSDKLISVDKAHELFPDAEVFRESARAKSGRVVFDGRAEALLIAEYGRRQIK